MSKNILKKSIVRIGLITGVILIIPLLFKFPWTRSDFIVAGIILFLTGSTLDIVINKGGKYRISGAIIIVFLFLWLWAELAVGLFTNWGS